VQGGHLPAAAALQAHLARHGESDVGEQRGEPGGEDAVPQLGGVQPVDRPRRALVAAGQRVQVEYADAVIEPGDDAVDRRVERHHPSLQDPAQRCR
jgi:hypothetical protein